MRCRQPQPPWACVLPQNQPHWAEGPPARQRWDPAGHRQPFGAGGERCWGKPHGVAVLGASGLCWGAGEPPSQPVRHYWEIIDISGQPRCVDPKSGCLGIGDALVPQQSTWLCPVWAPGPPRGQAQRGSALLLSHQHVLHTTATATMCCARQSGLEDSGVSIPPPALEEKSPKERDGEVWGRQRGGLAHPQPPGACMPPLGQAPGRPPPGGRSIPTA